MTTTPTPIYPRIRELFPNADAYHGSESAIVEWSDGVMVVDHDGAVYRLGIYPDGSWQEGDEPAVMVDVTDADVVVVLVDDLTELEPDGVSWSAWATQWLRDAVADERYPGVALS